jgi:LysM repeat protein
MFARTDTKVIILILLMAVILALGGALSYFYLLGRPEFPDGTYVVDVKDTKVLVRSNPKKAVQIVSTPPVDVPTLSPNPTPVEVPTLAPTATRSLCVIFEQYQVQPGDTLYSISNKRNTTIALMARFGIDATDIVPGDTIPLPVADPACCPGNSPYVVREGDTLSSIAVKCETTIDNLKQINGFGDIYRLDETDVICVPAQG